MKFNARTIQILRNFSSIHQALIFKPGNVIKAMSDTKSILAKASLETEIEGSFAIYDMSKFLGAISMFDDPILTCKGSYIEIRQGNEKIDYVCAEPSLIKAPPEKDIALPSVDVEFTLKDETINRVLKGMAITGANVMCITGDGERIFLEAKTVASSKNQQGGNGTPSYRAEVGSTDKTFSFIFSADNIKLMAGDYDVSVTQKGLAHFVGKDIEYWVAVESTSTYEG
jgi:hypothetical protein